MTQQITPQATSSLSVWLDYLNHIHTSAIDLGLERVALVAQRAQLTKPAPTVITVAGTNGKGSTCALMEAILLAAGYQVAVYSSPHLIRYNERLRINGQELSDAEHTQAFAYIEQQRQEVSLSLFEFGTLAALYLTKQAKVDVLLLEVGLGGRLDATNVVDHDVSVITSLAVDHVDWLGSDLNTIAFEKAGIFRTQRPAICGQPQPPSTVAAHADDIGAKLYQVGINFSYQVTGEQEWAWRSKRFELTQLPIPRLPLANAATALMALGCSGLSMSDLDIVEGLNQAQLAGRMHILQTQPLIILDVAHNPHSAHYFVEQMRQNYPNKKLRLVLGMLHDKDIKSTIEIVKPIVSDWYLASLSGPRAAQAKELQQYLTGDETCYENPVAAFNAARAQLNEHEILAVIGSFHTVGEVLEHWQQQGG